MIILIIITIFLTTAVISATTPVKHESSTPDESTIDEATPDIATRDEATVCETQSQTEYPTESPETEPPTEEPTEVSWDEPAEEYDEADDQSYEEPDENYDEDNNDSSSDFSLDDLEWLARAICLEAGGCSERCQWLVGSTVVNLANRYNNGDILATVTDTSMFSVANYLFTKEPSATNWSVAERVLSGDRDTEVMAFRTDYYHSFGSPYDVVDNVYFSTY